MFQASTAGDHASSSGAAACGSGNRARRLALICQRFYPEMVSTGLHMSELSRALASLGWNIRVYCAIPAVKDTAAEVPVEDEWNGVSIRRIAPWGAHGHALIPRLIFAISYAVAVVIRLVRERRSIQGVLATTNPPFLGLAAVVMRRVFGIRYCMIVYDVYPEIAVRLGMLREGSIIARMWSAVTRVILANASAVVVIGRDMEAVVRRKLGRSSVPAVFIPNWSDENNVRPVSPQDNNFVKEKRLQGRFIVQYAGNIGRTHNLELLIEAARLLVDREEILFQFVGEGANKQRLRQMAASYRLCNVQFLPEQPVSCLAETLSAATVAVVTLGSSFTGFSVPSKTYGIMAAGVPVLAVLDPGSEIGCTVIENGCGIVLSPHTPGEVAAAISRLAGDAPAIARMGTNARRAFLSMYTLSAAAARYDAMLKSIFQATPYLGAGSQTKGVGLRFEASRGPL